MSTSKIVFCAGLFGAAVAWCAVADATNQMFLPVNACQKHVRYTGNPATDIAPAMWTDTHGGLNVPQNVTPVLGTFDVRCALGQDQAYDGNDQVFVAFDDENGIDSKNITCSTYAVYFDDTSWISYGTKFGCSTTGGCAADPHVYAGENYIQLGMAHGQGWSTALNCSFPPYDGVAGSRMIGIQIVEQ